MLDPHAIVCPRCEGSGEEPGAPSEAEGIYQCNVCRGHGLLVIEDADGVTIVVSGKEYIGKQDVLNIIDEMSESIRARFA